MVFFGEGLWEECEWLEESELESEVELPSCLLAFVGDE